MGYLLVRSMLMATVSVAATVVAVPSAAQAREQGYDVNIPAQSLADALRALGRATRQNVVFDGATVRGKRSVAVRGRYSAREALDRMLAGSGLTVSIGDGGVLMVRLGNAEPGAETASTVGGDENDSREEIVVTGTNIRGVSAIAAPSVNITRDEIERSGHLSVQEVLESLPQNFEGVSTDTRTATGGSQFATTNTLRVVAVDLRGLGPQSTLTLINGKRRAGALSGQAVDISAIPLSAIERVEVVTGGRSAIYGSDAVGGVVNFVTRRSFDGAESQGSISLRDGGGGQRLQLSQVVGQEFSRGGFLISYDYSDEKALDLVKTGLIVSPSINNIALQRFDIQPDSHRHSAFLAGNFNPVDWLELYAEGLYSNGKSKAVGIQLNGSTLNDTRSKIDNEQYNVTVGARFSPSPDWEVDVSASQSESDFEYLENQILGTSTFVTDRVSRASLRSVSAIATGSFPNVLGVSPRTAFGVEYRKEESSTGLVNGENQRSVHSAFVELLLPMFISAGNTSPVVEISLAGRLDDYSGIGSTFNPQFGAIVRPSNTLRVRATYAESFRAPELVLFTPSARLDLLNRTDPHSPTGSSPVLQLGGLQSDLRPETARTYTLSLDYEPTFLSDTTMTLSYFKIDYENRIELPAVGADLVQILALEERFPGLINRTPDASATDAFFAADLDGQINSNLTGRPFDPATQSLLNVFPGLVLVDNRRTNVAFEKLQGIDFLIRGQKDLGKIALLYGINATYTIKHDRSVTTTSPAIEVINSVGKPADFRARVNIGVRTDVVTGSIFVTYIDGYNNPLSNPSSSISSWTTVDASLQVKLGPLLGTSGFDRSVLSFGVTNLFENDPPTFLQSSNGFRYDPANANARGRVFNVRLTHRW